MDNINHTLNFSVRKYDRASNAMTNWEINDFLVKMLCER